MISSSAIPLFREIADLYVASNLGRVPSNPTFDLFPLKADRSGTPADRAVGPHRRGFFQLSYLFSETEKQDALLASSPDQVLDGTDYLRPTFEYQHGFTLLFKTEVLAHQLASPSNEFPFFYQPASMALPVSADLREKLAPQFRAIESAANDRSPYQDRRVSALTAALLYDVRSLYEQAAAFTGDHRLCTQLACRFDEVVLQNFKTHHTVEDYARLMHVSADHLSAEIKARTGRNAREIVAERLITEAKYLLTYSELQASQIADQLGFSEPTHFTRFFKRHLEETPSEFRRRIRHSSTDRIYGDHSDSRAALAI